MSTDITAIILAAGLGVRMQSPKPKILHAAAGRSMVEHVIAGLRGAGIKKIRLVVGHGADQVRDRLKSHKGLEFFVQKEQLGTADAVRSAEIGSIMGDILICNGDHPLISAEDYRNTITAFGDKNNDLLVVTTEMKNPFGFGRIVRTTNGKIFKIVEEKDATPQERLIREVNTGQYMVKADVLKEVLPRVENKNVKGEFYLTDIVTLALGSGKRVDVSVQRPRVGRGVNNQSELAQASRALYVRKIKELLNEGVVISDPMNTYVDMPVKIGAGTHLFPGSFIIGNTVIGKDCVIEPYCQIKNSVIADKVEIRWGSIIDQSEVKSEAVVGPYARLRPETVVCEKAQIGNFVELKKVVFGKGSKANHLTYLGDAEIGENTNIGCGTITCNYAVDHKKYKTVIGDNCFIGSDSQFIAPVSVGDNAVVGSGSTITKDVPANALAVARSKQFIKPDYTKG